MRRADIDVLHVPYGDSSLGSTKLPGVVAALRDSPAVGPSSWGLSLEDYRRQRVRHWGPNDAVVPEWSRFDPLSSDVRVGEYVLWATGHPGEQMNVLRVLARLAALGRTDVAIVEPTSSSSGRRYRSIGEIARDEIERLFTTKRPVTAQEFERASIVWDAFTRGEAATINDEMHRNEASLAHLSSALRAVMRELPSTSDGLSATERIVLGSVRHHPQSFGTRVVAVFKNDDFGAWTGDSYLSRFERSFVEAKAPLMFDVENGPRTAHAPDRGITSAGIAVLEQVDDRCRLIGIERTIGGFVASGHEPSFRWDRVRERIAF